MKDSNHFNFTFWYIAAISLIILGYVIAITFFPIPKENQRFVDISLAFLLGFMSSAAAFLTGGTPTQAKKPNGEPGSTTAEISATIHSEPKEENGNE